MDQAENMRSELTKKDDYFRPVLERTLQEGQLRGSHVTTAVAFGPEIRNSKGKSRRRLVASAYSDGGLTLWNVPTSRFGDNKARGELVSDMNSMPSIAYHDEDVRSYHLSGHIGAINDICFAQKSDVPSMDKALLASAGADGAVRIWSPASKEGESIVINAHRKDVNSVDFGSDSASLLLSCSNDKTAKIWHLPSQKFACSFIGHTNWVRAAKFSPDSRLVATGSDDKTVKIWDAHYTSSQDTCIATYDLFSIGVSSLDFHPDRTILAAASNDIKFWDLRSNSLIQHYPSDIVSDPISTIGFHPSGNYLLSADINGKATIWDVREGRFLVSLDISHRGSESKDCASARFSSCGRSLITGETHRSVKLWSTKNLDLCLDFVGGSSLCASDEAVLFADGQQPKDGNLRSNKRNVDEESPSLARSLSKIFANSANALGINSSKDDCAATTVERNLRPNSHSHVSDRPRVEGLVQSNDVLLKLDELSGKVEQLSERLVQQDIAMRKLVAKIDQIENMPES